MSSVLLTNGLVIAVLMVLVWLISLPLRNASLVDLVWGLGFVVVAWTTFLRSEAPSVPGADNMWVQPSRWLLPLLTTLWGVRLSLYLAWRNLGHGEDKRYVAMRSARPQTFWWQSLFLVFVLQGTVMWVVALPLQWGIAQPGTGWTWLHCLGVCVWSMGFYFESVGDWQLARFKSRPENRGLVCTQGLWRYTRHPNYFGDFCVWWGCYFVAIAHGSHLWTVLSPALMSYFLMRVSGVTLLEQGLLKEKPHYAEYIRHTNAFFPGPPRGQ